MASDFVQLDFDIVIQIGSNISLCICWEFQKGFSFVAIYFKQYSLNCAVGSFITNAIAELQTFVRADLSSSDVAIINNQCIVVVFKIVNLLSCQYLKLVQKQVANRLRLLKVIMSLRTARMRYEYSNRYYFFCRLCCPYAKLAAIVFAANNITPFIRGNNFIQFALL